MRMVAMSMLLFSMTCHAVSLAVNGVGQVLIYPYFTVRNIPAQASPFNALVSVVNSSALGKVLKVRVREALTGASIYELNAFLGRRDVWTFAIVPTANGAGILTADTSCTLPTGLAATGVPSEKGTFTTANYVGDPLGADPGRVREGFIEVLEMGTIRRDSALERAVTHTGGRAPCDLGSEASIVADLDPPAGRLFGSLTEVNVLEGTAYEYDAVALEQWSDVAEYWAVGTGRPTLGDAKPAISSVVVGRQLIVSPWTSGVDAVSAVLAVGTTQAEFMRDAAVNGATDIVYTAPTKPLLVSATTASPPFSQKLTNIGACEFSTDYSMSRDEEVYFPDANSFGPDGYAAMCWVTTVQSLNATWPNPTAVIGSRANLRHYTASNEVLPLPTVFSSGVAGQAFIPSEWPRELRPSSPTVITDIVSGTQTISGNVAYRGLPIIGVTMMRYVNGVVPVAGQSTLSNYGAGATVKGFADISIQ